LRRQRKVPKRKATLLSVSLRFASGSLRCSRAGRAAELTPRCALRSNNCGKSVCESWGCPAAPPTAPRAALLGTDRRALKTEKQKPNIHTGHRCARPHSQLPRLWEGWDGGPPGPSAAMARVEVQPLVDAPASGCWRGGMSASALMLRRLTRRGCPNGAAQQRSEFGGAPRKRPDAGCPFAQRRGRRQQGEPFLVTFFGQKKLLRCRAHTPAPDLCHEARTKQPPRLHLLIQAVLTEPNFHAKLAPSA